ncbi:tyrosine-type recombinase/integrase [Caulifigura coniformis]|nr:site-specific integrase [Caulifigura coniformis]
MLVTEVGPLQIERLLSVAALSGVRPRTLQAIYQVTRHSFEFAVRVGLRSDNPCNAVPRPRVPLADHSPLTRSEVHQLLANVDSRQFRNFYDLAIQTGARQGELRALWWRDVHLEQGDMLIQASLCDAEGKPIRKPPKTRCGRRKVVLTRSAIEALMDQKRYLEDRRLPIDGFVFKSRSGRALSKSSIQKQFKSTLRRAGLPSVRFHDLRHTHATLMLEAGVHVKVVQERLGHSSSQITLDFYSHVMPSMQEEGVRQFENYLSTAKLCHEG